MTVLRIAILIMLIVLGGVGVLFGGVTTIGMLSSGEVAYTVPQTGGVVARTVSRAGEPDAFWRLFGLLGLLPLVLGGAAAWYGWRSIGGSDQA